MEDASEQYILQNIEDILRFDFSDGDSGTKMDNKQRSAKENIASYQNGLHPESIGLGTASYESDISPASYLNTNAASSESNTPPDIITSRSSFSGDEFPSSLTSLDNQASSFDLSSSYLDGGVQPPFGSGQIDDHIASPSFESYLNSSIRSVTRRNDEFTLINQFLMHGVGQFPIIDKDLFILRYNYKVPSPLPAYLIQIAAAVGAKFVSQMKDPIVSRSDALSLLAKAKAELATVAMADNTIDSVVALLLLTFHWEWQVTGHERMMLMALAVNKVVALRLHKAESYQGLAPRDAGLQKLIFWFARILDAMSSRGSNHVSSFPPEIDVTLPEDNDMQYMFCELLTGTWRNPPGRVVFYLRHQIWLAELYRSFLQLDAESEGQDALISISVQLDQWKQQAFPELALMPNNLETSGLLNGMRMFSVHYPFLQTNYTVILHFGYHELIVRLHTAILKPSFLTDATILNDAIELPTSTGTGPSTSLNSQSPPSTVLDPHIRLLAIDKCLESAEATMDIFLELIARGYVGFVTRIVLYLTLSVGKCVQYLYGQNVPGRTQMLLDKWETCLIVIEGLWAGRDFVEVDL